MDYNHPQNLAEFVDILFKGFFKDLDEHASAKDLIVPGSSGLAQGIIKLYRHVLAVAWVFGMVFVSFVFSFRRMGLIIIAAFFLRCCQNHEGDDQGV